MSIENVTLSSVEDDDGNMTAVDVCIRLDDTLAGLERDLEFILTVMPSENSSML